MGRKFLAAVTAGLAVTIGLTAVVPAAMASGSPAAARAVHRWRIVSPPPPQGVSSYPLNLVSCFAPGTCLAIGTALAGGTGQASSQLWTGKRWGAKVSPLPAIPSFLSCATARSCTAVGSSVVDGNDVEMAEHWDGATWTLQTTPPPPAGAIESRLAGVSCPAASSCFAIGDYRPDHGHLVPLAEHWDGLSWKPQAIAGPPSKTYFGFGGLSCSSPQSCLAVGEYGHGLFSDTWNGTRWTAKLITRPGSSDVPRLQAISCSSANACVAVGGSAWLWNGTKWRKIPPAEPYGQSASLLSVSCTSAANCEAVGLPAGTQDRSAELWNGRKWSTQRGLPMPTSRRPVFVAGVSCATRFSCLAVGSYQTHAGFQPLAARYS